MTDQGNMSDLWKRLRFVFFAILVYRIGTHIPIPGIDPDRLAALFQQNQGTIIEMFNLFSGGALERMSIFDQEIFRSAYLDYSSTIPVHKRIRKDELKLLLDREFRARNILTFYEFGIYNNGLATKVKSNEYIENQKGSKYETPIFDQDNGQTPYKLLVTFPYRDQVVFSSILSVAGLSIFLTLFIIIVSTTAIYQIIPVSYTHLTLPTNREV